MTTHSNNSKEQLEKTLDFLTEDIESLDSAELQAAMAEVGLSPADAESMIGQAAQACRRALGARRFALAKQQVRDSTGHRGQVVSIDGGKAKSILAVYWKNNPSERPTTLAARKGDGLSDDTALKMYESLVELGAIEPDSTENV
jgi:hypothetical protein